MITTKGELRNMTTGILHTNITDVYKFCEDYLGAEGIMTHQLPGACKAVLPILKTKLPDEWFIKEWIKEGLDQVVELADLTEDEKKLFWQDYSKYASEMWDNIKDKTIVVQVGRL